MKIHSMFADTLLSGSGEETCARMELRQDTDQGARSIKGAGYMRGGPDGQIRFKIFVPEFENTRDPLGSRNDDEAGLIIPRDRYYRLHAVDQFGGNWTSQRILPVARGSAVEGILAEIYCTERFDGREPADPLDPAALDGGGITLWFPGTIELPFNAATLTTRRVDTFGRPAKRLEDDHDFPSFRRNVTRFSTDGCDFDIIQDENHYNVTIRSLSRFPPHLFARVVETLQFVLGKTVSWRVSDTTSGGRKETLIRSTNGVPDKSYFLPPLRCWQQEDLNGDFTIKLFDCYFRFITRRGDAGWDPCSVHLYNAITASTNSVDAYSLALGVAAEGVCNSLYGDLAAPSADETLLLQELIEYLEKWPETIDDSRRLLADRLRSRVRGSLSNLGRVRAEDRMNKLVKSGAVERRHVAAWKRLRNPSSHAELPDPKNAQQDATRRFSVCMLMYQMIFHKIGYEGYYNDYSSPNFPTRYYRLGHADNGSPPTLA